LVTKDAQLMKKGTMRPKRVRECTESALHPRALVINRSQMSHKNRPNGYPKQQKWQQKPIKVFVEGPYSRPLIVILSGVAKLCEMSPQYQSNRIIKWHPSVAKMVPIVNPSADGRNILEITNSYLSRGGQLVPSVTPKPSKSHPLSPI
jgi:hypothetical protein